MRKTKSYNSNKRTTNRQRTFKRETPCEDDPCQEIQVEQTGKRQILSEKNSESLIFSHYGKFFNRLKKEGMNLYTLHTLRNMGISCFGWCQAQPQTIADQLLENCIFFHMNELEIAAWSLLVECGLGGCFLDLENFLLVTSFKAKEIMNHPEKAGGYFQKGIKRNPNFENLYLEWFHKHPVDLTLEKLSQRYSKLILSTFCSSESKKIDLNESVSELLAMTPYISKDEGKKFINSKRKSLNEQSKEIYTKEASLKLSANKEEWGKFENSYRNTPLIQHPFLVEDSFLPYPTLEVPYNEDMLMPQFLRCDSTQQFFQEEFLQKEAEHLTLLASVEHDNSVPLINPEDLEFEN